MRKDSDAYTMGFAAAVCLACSVVLALASVGLKSRQDAAAELDRKINVLKVFGIPVIDPATREKITETDVIRLFKEHIAETGVDAQGRELPTGDLLLYKWKQDGHVTQYAFPVSGKGLWSTIHGYLAISNDFATILGITFHRHGETPGLGGEIEKDWFTRQFQGRKFFAQGRVIPLEVVKGKVRDRYPAGNDHAVDGISGATLTGNGVQAFLNNDISRYEPYFRNQRKP